MERKPNGYNDRYILAALAEGRFIVSPSTGRITDLDHRLVDCELNLNGYRVVQIDGHRCFAHRIVWIACEDPIPLGMQINHRNYRRTDNRICNLEVVTAAENMAHARRTVYYDRIRDDDLEAVDSAWLDRVLTLAEAGDVSPDDIAALRPEPRGPVGSPEYTRWHADQKVDQRLSGAR